MERKKIFRSVWFWVALFVLVALVSSTFFSGDGARQEVSTSTALEQFDEGNVESATINDKEQTLDLDLRDEVAGEQASSPPPTRSAPPTTSTTSWPATPRVPTASTSTPTSPRTACFVSLLISLLPIVVLLLLLFWLFMSQMQGGGRGVMNFGKSKAKLVSKDTPKTTFADVAGADEAVEELHEIKDFLQNPAKYQALGAKIPKGVLLYGPPGTGKTLLARAVAGEAGVPFYSISGSDFVEMFVGVGASRVRDLFEQAKANAPGDHLRRRDRRRRPAPRRRHGRRARRARADAQPAARRDGRLRRQGRRDPHRRHEPAGHPRPGAAAPGPVRPADRRRRARHGGPQGDPAVHAKGKPFAPDVDLDSIARRTPGFTGADLANVINEAALLTARHNRALIDDATLEESIDRVIAGPERRTRAMSDKEKKITAYHEGGHALVA